MPRRQYQLNTGFDVWVPPPVPAEEPPGGFLETVGAAAETARLAVTTLVLPGAGIAELANRGVLAPAFRMENDVVNWVDLATRPKYELDSTFDVESAARNAGVWNDYKWNFVGTRNQQEFDDTLSRIKREEMDRAILSRSGPAGFVAMQLAGLISPVNLLPFVGPGVRGAKAIAIGAVYGLLAGAAQEIPLQIAQETRTTSDTVWSVASSTVLGGILGGAVGYVNSKQMRAIEDYMANAPRAATIPTSQPFATIGLGDVGAKALREEAGRLHPRGDFGDFVAEIGPVSSTLNSRSPQGRWMMAQLADGGLGLEANRVRQTAEDGSFIGGIATNIGGTAENLIKTHWARAAQFIRELDQQYAQYMLGKQGMMSLPQRLRAEAMSLNPRRTKLSKQEFKREVSRAMFSGDRHDIPEVQAAAEHVRKTVYDPLYKMAQDVGIYKARTGAEGDDQLELAVDEITGDASYLNRDYNLEAVARGRTRFIDTLARHFAGKLMDEFSKALEKVLGKVAAAEQSVADLALKPEEVEALREALRERLKTIDEGRSPEEVDLEDFIADARSMARDRGLTEQQRADAREMARILEERGGKGFAERSAERRALKKRINVLNRSVAALGERQAAKLLKMERTEELALASLNRAVRRAQKFLTRIEKASPEALQKEISELKNAFAKTADEYDRAEARLGKLEEDEFWKPQESVPSVVTTPAPKSSTDEELAALEPIADRATALRDAAETLDYVLTAVPKSLRDRIESTLEDKANSVADLADILDDVAEFYNRNGSPGPASLQKAIRQLDAIGTALTPEQAVSRRRMSYDVWRDEYKGVPLEVLQSLETGRAAPFTKPNGLEVRPPPHAIAKRALDEAIAAQLPRAANSAKESAVTRAGARITDRADRLTDISERLGEAESWDPEELQSLIQEGLDEMLSKVNRLNGKRYARGLRLKEQAAGLDPAHAKEALDRLKKKIPELRTEFHDEWTTRGAEEINLVPGFRPNFSKHAKDIAQTVVEKIEGSNARLAGYDLLMEPRGAELARVLDIPSKEIEDFLEMDIENLVHRYIRTLAPDIEIMKKLGEYAPDMGRNMEFRKLNDEWEAAERVLRADLEAKGVKPETIDARARELGKEYRAIKRNLEAVIGRLRGTWGVPRDPMSKSARLGRIAMNLNVLRYMNMVTVSSFPDLAQPIYKYGLLRTFRDGYVPFIKGLAKLQLTPRELKLAGAALDLELHSRAHAISNIGDVMVRGSKFEKSLEWATSKIGLIGLFDAWTSMMKGIAGTVANVQLVDDIRLFGQNSGTVAERAAARERLAEKGITGDLAQALWYELSKPGGSNVVNGILWPNTEVWSNVNGAVDAYRGAMVRETERMIVTPGVERPKFMDANLGMRIATQFQSFGMSSTTKTFLAALQKRDMAVMTGAMVSLALGTVSYYIAAKVTGGKVEEDMERALEQVMRGDPEGLGKFADEAIDRSGILAAGQIGRDVLSHVPLVDQYVNFAGEQSSRQDGNDIFQQMAGPTYGDMLSLLSSLAGSLEEDGAGHLKLSPSMIHKIRLMAPLQNHFALRRAFDAIENAFGGNRR